MSQLTIENLHTSHPMNRYLFEISNLKASNEFECIQGTRTGKFRRIFYKVEAEPITGKSKKFRREELLHQISDLPILYLKACILLPTFLLTIHMIIRTMFVVDTNKLTKNKKGKAMNGSCTIT